MIRRDVVSVSRRSECHETSRCNCRFGCSSAAAGAAAAAAGSSCAVGMVVNPATPVLSSVVAVAVTTVVVAVAGGGGGGGAAGGETSTSARSECRCGRGERDEAAEAEDGAAVVPVGCRAERKSFEEWVFRVCCPLRKSLHEDVVSALTDADGDSENVASCCCCCCS